MTQNEAHEARADAVPESPNALDDQGRKTGRWSESDPHGGVIVGDYLDGERHGTWRHYSLDGRLRSEGPYEHGALHGTWTWYRANGALMQRGGIDHDVKHGRWERWDAQGRPLDAGDYDQGRKAGEWTTFSPDGTAKAVKRHRAKQ